MPVKYIPDGYHTVTPFLIVPGAEKFLAFVKAVFDAQEKFCMLDPTSGTIRHAEARVGDSTIMFCEASEQYPAALGMLHVYIPDIDGVFKKAIQAGGTSIMEPANQFYGDRSGGLKDPCGNTWWLATHVEDLTKEEMKRRGDAQMKTAK